MKQKKLREGFNKKTLKVKVFSILLCKPIIVFSLAQARQCYNINWSKSDSEWIMFAINESMIKSSSGITISISISFY